VDAYQMFSHKNIIKMLVRTKNERERAYCNLFKKDSSTITEPDESKTIYIFLPYYRVSGWIRY
jgi:serine/threonine kinase 16